MKTKILALIAALALLLAACEGVATSSKSGDLGLEEIEYLPTAQSLPDNVAFRDDLDQDVSADWGLKVVSGLQEQLLLTQNNGQVRIELLQNPNDANFLFINRDKTYEDVVVQAEFEYRNTTDTFVAVVCRVTDEGWYELRVNNAGHFQLLKFSQYLADQGKNAHETLSGQVSRATSFKTGKEPNVISLSCVGNQISAFINGEQLIKDRVPLVVEDDSFSSGSIGFGISATGSTTDIIVDWVEAIKP